MKKEPRLQFTDEERAVPELQKPIRKAEKAAKKADKAHAKVPQKKVKKRSIDPETGKVKTVLQLEDKKPPSKLNYAVRDAPVNFVSGQFHREMSESEDDNVGVESAHKLEAGAETGGRLIQTAHRSHQLKPYRTAERAETRLEKANLNALYKEAELENPTSNPLSKWQQRQAIKKQYAASKTEKAAETTKKTAEAAGTAAKKAAEEAKKAAEYVWAHKKGFAIAIAIVLILAFFLNGLSSCSVMVESLTSGIAASTYPSQDEDMLGAEAAYCALEDELQDYLDTYERTHDYDEYTEVSVTLMCGSESFTAKGKTILSVGWKRYEQESEEKAEVLPELNEGQTFSASELSVKEGKTTPPKHYTEDTILSAMETAGEKDMPDDAERKGIGTPATRAGILEKLVSSGFVERKKSKKLTNLIPTSTGTALITVLPEQLQSPQLTAEWENKLKAIELGKLDSDSFMEDIQDMLRELLKTYTPVPGAEVLFPSSRKNGGEIIGKCPRCGGNVTESQKGFFCDNRDCKFALWKNSSFFTKKKKQFTKPVAAALLKDGCIRLTGCYSEKTGKTYDATVLLCDDGEKTEYKLDFGKEKKA